jgi:ABC-2 type transport system permease protein
MIQLVVLVRKHATESRWMLGISSTAFFLLGWLTSWLAHRFEVLIDKGEIGPAVGRVGVMRVLGGPAMDYSTTALEIMWWNHPVIILTVLAWAVSRGSAAAAGEIERGTIDVTLSRPVSRSSYLSSQVIFTFLGLVLLVLMLILGVEFGRLFYTMKAPPSVLTLLKPATMVVALGLAVFGYTLPFSAADVVRWRPTLFSSAITLTGLVAYSLASQFPDYKTFLQSLTVFDLYAPVTVALKGDPLLYNTGVLLLIFVAGLVVSYVLFLRRDLPSNS